MKRFRGNIGHGLNGFSFMPERKAVRFSTFHLPAIGHVGTAVGRCERVFFAGFDVFNRDYQAQNGQLRTVRAAVQDLFFDMNNWLQVVIEKLRPNSVLGKK